MPGNDPVSVFFLYAPEDESLRIALEKHLAVLKREGIVHGFSERVVRPGEDFRREIERYIDEARIILILLSADLLASDYYDAWMRRALDRSRRGVATVIPVVARPIDWESLSLLNEPGPINEITSNSGTFTGTEFPSPILLTSYDDIDEGLAYIASQIRERVRPGPRNPP